VFITNFLVIIGFVMRYSLYVSELGEIFRHNISWNTPLLLMEAVVHI